MTKPGVYRHWKGGLYTVLMCGVNSTNNGNREDVVIYCSLTTGQVYVRLESEFNGVKFMSDRPGHCVQEKRFVYLGDTVPGTPPVRI